MGSKHPNIAPYQAYETADGYVVVGCSADSFWPRLCDALDRPDLLADERFEVNEKRVRNREALDEALGAEFAAMSTEAAVETLTAHDVPASHVRDMAELFDDPQIEARNMRVTVDHPTAGEVEMPGSPMKFSRTPTTVRRHPPILGEHTEDVLSEYGYTDADLARLADADVIPTRTTTGPTDRLGQAFTDERARRRPFTPRAEPRSSVLRGSMERSPRCVIPGHGDNDR